MRRKLKYQDVQNFSLLFLLPRWAHSELCNQSGGEKHGQKSKRDCCFNKCRIPEVRIFRVLLTPLTYVSVGE